MSSTVQYKIVPTMADGTFLRFEVFKKLGDDTWKSLAMKLTREAAEEFIQGCALVDSNTEWHYNSRGGLVE